MIEWLNENNGAVQALSAVALVLLTVALVIATFVYAWLTNKMLAAQQHVEVRAEFDYEYTDQPSNQRTELRLSVGNLSRVGIWVERIEIFGTEMDETYGPVSRFINAILQPDSTHPFNLGVEALQAFDKSEQRADLYIGSVSVTVEYFALGKWRSERAESGQITLDRAGLVTPGRRDTPPPRVRHS